MIKYILFDLDETLYPSASGLMDAISHRMREFIMNKYALTAEQAQALRERYWSEYGTTLRGLYIEREMDPSEYLQYVHDLPLANFLAPDPELRAVLARIPQTKVIVTNADAAHAQRILDLLGVADQFSRIFDIVCQDYDCKPSRAVYERVLQTLNARAAECVLVEDLARNLPPARELGIKTVLLRADGNGNADLCIDTIYQVADAISSLSN